MSLSELDKQFKTEVPLKVRLYYVNVYYDMARQAFKKQYLDYRAKVEELVSKYSVWANVSAALSSRLSKVQKRRHVMEVMEQEEPFFQTHIKNTDLV